MIRSALQFAFPAAGVVLGIALVKNPSIGMGVVYLLSACVAAYLLAPAERG